MSNLEPRGSTPLSGPETNLDAAIERYLASKTKAEGGGNYAKHASYVLSRFHQWATDRGLQTVDDLDKHDLAAYATELKVRVGGDELTPESANAYYDVVSGFCSWCVRRDLLGTNPARKEVATEELPQASGSGKQQFWSVETRELLLRYLDWKVEDVLEHEWMPPERVLRDRAYIGLLALSGARNAELLNAPDDDRRNGLRWRDVDLDAGLVRVLGKSQQREEVPLPDRVANYLRALQRRQDPPTDDWPLFPTEHAPSKYRAVREAHSDRGVPGDKTETLLEENDIDAVLRDEEVAPPALTTEGGRQLVRALSKETNLREDGNWLEPHGARRGVGQAFYVAEGLEQAQRVLRHSDPQVTAEQYSHVETAELKEAADRIFGPGEEG